MISRPQIQSQPIACHDDALAGLREILRVTRMDTIEVELEALSYATMKRNRHARSASGRLLLAVAALLPAAIRTRWCEEWLAELHALPARRDRVRIAIHTAFGIPQLAFTVRMPAWGHRRSG
jgi:hypothetical protein